MDALGVMHTQRCFHRDVAPDNILMLFERRPGAAGTNAGASYLEQPPRPVLLDFGAARRVIGDATQNLTAFLKSGYTPVEQYEGAVTQRQGAWTDVYALCAVLYTAAIGKAPPSSINRIVRDELVPAREAGKGRYSDAFLAAVDAGLGVRPEQRPQSMAALRALLDADDAPPRSPVIAAAPAAVAAPAVADLDLDLDLGAAPAARKRRGWRLPLAAGVLSLLAGAAAWLLRR